MRFGSPLVVRWLLPPVLLAVAGGLALQWFRRSESTPALRGQRVAAAMGCLACHGANGQGGVVDPGSRGGRVPGWDGPTVATLCRDEAEVREWILDGRPARLTAVADVARRTPLLPMPAYRERLPAAELADLLVYFQAVSGFGAEMSDSVYEGWRQADRLGCFACHGPAGMGGAPNPGSFKGHIPAWDGDEYPELVANEAEFREWVLDGRVQRLWANPVARHFLAGQVVQMPAYRSQLSDDQLNQLTAYVTWRRREHPAPSAPGKEDAHKIIGLIARPVAAPLP